MDLSHSVYVVLLLVAILRRGKGSGRAEGMGLEVLRERDVQQRGWGRCMTLV